MLIFALYIFRMVTGNVTITEERLMDFLALPNSQIKVLVVALKLADADGVLELSKGKKDQMCSIISIRRQTLSNNLVRLQTVGALQNVGYGKYKINTEFIYKD